MSIFFETQESVYIVVLMVMAVTFAVFMYGQTVGTLQDVRETGKLLIGKVYFHEVLTAPCLSADNTKNEARRYIYDVNKLDKGDLSCLDFGGNKYRIYIEDIDNSKEWDFGDTSIKFQMNQTISILDEEKVHIGFVKFSVCKPEECE